MTDKEIEILERKALKYVGSIATKIEYIGEHKGLMYFLPTFYDSPTSGFGQPFLVKYNDGKFSSTSFDEYISLTPLLQNTQQNQGR